jgi:hypothetical protein
MVPGKVLDLTPVDPSHLSKPITVVREDNGINGLARPLVHPCSQGWCHSKQNEVGVDEVLSGKSEGKDATGKNKFPASKEK